MFRCSIISIRDRLVVKKNDELEEDARVALSAAAQGQAQVHALSTARPDEATDATTFVDTATFADASLAPESSKSTVAKVKKKGKPKLTPKEKKERSVRELLFIYCFPHFNKLLITLNLLSRLYREDGDR